MVNADVDVEVKDGQVLLRVRGDDPSHPWLLVFQPRSSYELSNRLFRASLEANGSAAFPLTVTAGNQSQPVKQPPVAKWPVQKRLPAPPAAETGPQSSVDGIPAGSGNLLVGDSF